MYKIRLYVVPEQEEVPEDEEEEDEEHSPPPLPRRNSRRSAAVRVNVLQKDRRSLDAAALPPMKPRQISMKPRNEPVRENLSEKHGLLRQQKIVSQERIVAPGNPARKDGPLLPQRNVFASPKIKQLALDLQEKMMERNAKIRGNNIPANRPIVPCRANSNSPFKVTENVGPLVLPPSFAQENPKTRTLVAGNDNDDDNNNNMKNRNPDGMNIQNRDNTAGQYKNLNNNPQCKVDEEKITDSQDRLRIPNSGPTNKRGACEYLENRTEVLVFGKNCRNREQFHGRSPKIVRVKDDAGGDQEKDVLDGDVTAALKDKDERSQTVVLRRNSKLNGYKEYDLEQKIEVEIKMREGSARLLAAARHRAQSLEAARALLTSNERMSAYMAELQRRKREPSNKFSTSGSTARVSLSELRVPLMWRDSDHFKNRGDYRRFAVFCLARVGTEIHDTALLCPVDRALTDISFPDVLVFNNVPADFELTLEIYSHILQEDLSIASTPRRIKRTIHSSISKTVGKKLAASLRDELNSGKIGPHFELMASARLTLDDTDDNIHTHDLVINNLENKHHSLPLFGHFCCRLAAQPECINKEVCSGNISLNGRNYWARLQGFSIETWESRKLAEEEQNSIHTIPINRETSIQLSKSSPEELRIMNSIDGSEKVTLVRLESNEEAQKWLRQLVAHAKDHLRWKRAAETIQEVPCVESARNSFISNKRQGSLYDETPLIESVQSDYATSRPTVQEIFGLTPSTSLSSCSSTNSPPSLRSRSLSTSGTRKLSASALKSHWPFSNKSHD